MFLSCNDVCPQEKLLSKRLLENFGDIAAGLHFDAAKVQLGGSFEEEGVRLADDQ